MVQSRRTFSGRPQCGVALVLVLWTLVLLTVIAGSLTTLTRTELAMTRNLLDEVQARGLIEAGFTYILATYLGNPRAQAQELLPADGKLHEWRFDDRQLRVGLSGEDAKVDLNLADEELIGGALLSAGLEVSEAEALRDVILDWRDVDDLHRLAGAEDPEYQSEGYAYGARDGRFESVAELGLLYGMSKSVYDRIYPLFTVNSGVKTVNPRHADRGVLLAVPGVSAEQVDEFLLVRDSDNPLDSEAVFPESDKRYVSTADSGVFKLISEVELADGRWVHGEMVVDMRPRGIKRYRVLQVSYNAAASGDDAGQDKNQTK